MLFFRKPSAATVRAFLAEQGRFDLTYSAVGATAAVPPVGYVVDHTRIRLGEGERTFEAAKAALRRWQQFHLGWVEASSPETPIKKGEVVAVVARAIGLWWLNACRIIYVVDENEPVHRFGFAYGTLPAHAGTGEERFLVEWGPDNVVWYDVLAFSRPNLLLTRLGYAWVRRAQKRFGKESAAAMIRAATEVVQDALHTDPVGSDLRGEKTDIIPLYYDPHFTFRFSENRIIPRFHLEGVAAGRNVSIYMIDPGTLDRQNLLTMATTGKDGWVDLSEPIIVKAGEAFIAVPGTAPP
jgi:uncharacterized protein (UPF0548 family)